MIEWRIHTCIQRKCVPGWVFEDAIPAGALNFRFPSDHGTSKLLHFFQIGINTQSPASFQKFCLMEAHARSFRLARQPVMVYISTIVTTLGFPVSVPCPHPLRTHFGCVVVVSSPHDDRYRPSLREYFLHQIYNRNTTVN